MKSPTYTREGLEQAIRAAVPGGGLLSAADSFRAAARTLAESRAAGRKIVLITDGQRAGWGTARPPPGIPSATRSPRPDRTPRSWSSRWGCRRRSATCKWAGQASANVLSPGRAAKVMVHLANTGTDDIAEGYEVQLAVDGKIAALQKGLALAASTPAR